MAKRVKPDILELLKKSGIPFKIVKIKFDPEIEREVMNYVLKIEKAYRRAAKSTLRFKVALIN